MSDSYQPEDIAAYNESSLKALVRAITLSQGQFRLILVRCNYGALRERMVQCLRELSPVKIRELVLPESVKTLYTTIKTELGDEIPQALMVFGLESVSDLKTVLTSSNYIREEFSNHFPFPLVLWVNDEVFTKLLRIAPDLESWATSVEFKLTTDELLDFLRQKTDEIFTGNSTFHLENCFEVEAACQDLQRQGQGLEPELEASLEFVRGLDDFRYDRIDEALAHYQKSLALPNLGLERQGILLLNIARCYYRKAELNRAESHKFWGESRIYFKRCLNSFEQAQRPDLVAKHISQLGEVLRRLKAWNELKSLAEKALTVHQTHGEARQLAQDYGFLAEVALEQSSWQEANQLAQKALQLLSTIPHRKPNDWALHTFLLARSQQHLGQVQEALANLEQVRQNFNPQYDPQLYIDSLWELRSLYFEQGKYLEAFHIKQEQFQIEHQYGFRAFIGAGYLQPKRSSVNPAVGEVEQQGTIAQEIAVSSREQDVKRLKERISRNDCKLTVIHGQSGVGKSSILQGGLVPALHQQAIGERDVLPVLLRVYQDWVGALEAEISPPTLGGTGVQSPPELGDLGGEEGQERIDSALPSACDPPQPPLKRGENSVKVPLFKGDLGGSLSAAILEPLRNNAENNLLTVLIFDQFEEFFFVYSDQAKRRPFYDFLRVCLDIPFVKVILSLREDYLHYLLELDRLFDLTAINNNILDKGIRYYLGNFSPEDARSVVQSLTSNSQFPLETGLIEAFVQDLAGEVGEVRPIELQIVGMQLQTEKIITLEQYQQGWTKNKLVERFLEDVIHDCGAENGRTARLVLYLLTNENGTRPLKTRHELAVELGAEAKPLDLVLEIFVKSGLVLLLPEKPEYLYQLVHDYLVKFIRQQQGAELLAELKQAKEQQERSEKRLNLFFRVGLGVAIPAAFGFAFLAWQADYQRKQAEKLQLGQSNTLTRYSEELFKQGKDFDALLAGLQAGVPLKRVGKGKVDGLTQVQLANALWQALRGKITTLRGHDLGVNSVSFSPDGKTLASASGDNRIKLWEVATGKLLTTLTGHDLGVNSVSFSPDGKTLASGSDDGTIKLWEVATGKLLTTLTGHNSTVRSVSFSPDGKTLASGSDDSTIKLWEVATGKLLTTLTGHNSTVRSVSFSPDDKTLASGSWDNTIKLWEVATGKPLTTLTGHNSTVRSVSFSPDGKTLASGSDDTIKLWKVATGKLLTTLTGHKLYVNSVSFSPDGKTLASDSWDNTIKLWEVATGKPLTALTGHYSTVSSVSFSPDGKTLASGSDDKTIKLWEVATGKPLTTLTGHDLGVNSVSFSPDGKTLASESYDTIKLWEVATGKPLTALTGHNSTVNTVSFSPDGKTLASGSGKIFASGSQDNAIKLWEVATGKLLTTLTGHYSRVNSVSFSPDGKTLASGSDDKTIKLWEVATGKLLTTLTGHDLGVNTVSFSPDGKTLASGSDDSTIKLWEVATGKLLTTLTGHYSRVNSVSFSPDGKTLASGSDDNTIQLWEVATGKPLTTLTGHNSRVNSVSFSPDGKTLASGSLDNTIKLWEVATGKPITTLTGDDSTVRSVSFSPDGKTLASGSLDNTIKLWKLDLDFDNLLMRGCDWVREYLENNPNVSDRHLCDDIGTPK